MMTNLEALYEACTEESIGNGWTPATLSLEMRRLEKSLIAHGIQHEPFLEESFDSNEPGTYGLDGVSPDEQSRWAIYDTLDTLGYFTMVDCDTSDEIGKPTNHILAEKLIEIFTVPVEAL